MTTTSYQAVQCKNAKVQAGAQTTLAAIGAFDAFIVCNPEVPSFGGQTFARHTNFAVAYQSASVRQAPLAGNLWRDQHLVKFSFDTTERGADLIGPTFLHCYWQRLAVATPLSDATDLISWVNELGNAVVQQATFLVGNTPVEQHTGEALHCLGEFGIRGPALDEAQMLGKFDVAPTDITDPSNIPAPMRAWSSANRHTYAPLNFHFCQRKSEYFPLVAVQYNAPEIHINLRGKANLIKAVTAVAAPGPNIVINNDEIASRFASGQYVGGDLLAMEVGYSGVYLDTEERRVRAKNPYTYVFNYIKTDETVRVTANTTHLTRKVNFENATSSYWWFYRRDSITRTTGTQGALKDYFDFSVRQPWNSLPANVGGIASVYTPLNPFACARILVNNNVRVEADGMFFYQVNPYIALHNRLPREPHFINSYDFGMLASQWNYDNGSQNDSRIDNLVFEFTFENSAQNASTGVATNSGLNEDGTVFIYATKFSMAKIAGGQFGLAFSTI